MTSIVTPQECPYTTMLGRADHDELHAITTASSITPAQRDWGYGITLVIREGREFQLEKARVRMSSEQAKDLAAQLMQFALQQDRCDRWNAMPPRLSEELQMSLEEGGHDGLTKSVREYAQAVLRKARTDLGQDLGGFSAVDLLLDNISWLVSSQAAVGLLVVLGDPACHQYLPDYDVDQTELAKLMPGHFYNTDRLTTTPNQEG